MSDKAENRDTENNDIKDQKPETKQKNDGFLPGKDSMSGSPKPKFNIYWIYGLIILAIISIQFFKIGNHIEDISSSQFDDMLRAHDVLKVEVINKEKVQVYLKTDKIVTDKYKALFKNAVSKTGPQFTFNLGTVDGFVNEMKEIQKDFAVNEKITPEFKNQKDFFGELFGPLVWIVVLVGVWIFIFRRMSGGSAGGPGNIFNVGKSRAQIFDKDTVVKIDFKDVAGLEEAKVEIKEIVDF
jgi:AFG3 family protein